MNDFLEVCPHCRRDVKARVSEDIVFYGHWVGDCFLFDVLLFIPEASVSCVLYREVYVVK